MKLRGDKALAFCKTPSPNFRIAFIHGEDAGVAVDAARELAGGWSKRDGEPLEDVRLLDDEVKRDPALLIDALSARPLFGGRQLLRLHINNEQLAKPISECLSTIDRGDATIENYLILTGGEFAKKSKTVEALESSKHVVSLHVAADTDAALEDLVRAKLQSNDLQIDADALEAFIDELPGDRRLANSEIEKLSLYALDLGRSISLKDIESISATERGMGAEEAADAALSGNVKKAQLATDRYLEAGGNPVSALRTLHFRTLRIMDALAGERFLRPRVADADRPAFNAMLKAWNPARVSRALTLLYAAEKTCKQAGAPSEAAFKTVIDRISRRAI